MVRPRLACAAASPATAFSGTWEAKYPAIVKLWESAWAEFVPFLRFDREIRMFSEELRAAFRTLARGNARNTIPQVRRAA